MNDYLHFCSIFCHYKIFFLFFSPMLYIIMYIVNIPRAIKKMPVNEIRDFTFQNYCKRIGFPMEKQLLSNEVFEKKLLLLPNKLIEKITDPCNAKEHYQPFKKTQNQ